MIISDARDAEERTGVSRDKIATLLQCLKDTLAQSNQQSMCLFRRTRKLQIFSLNHHNLPVLLGYLLNISWVSKWSRCKFHRRVPRGCKCV